VRTLHERIAAALGWKTSEAQSFSLLALRDLVRPVSAKLAAEITERVRASPFKTHRVLIASSKKILS